MLLKVKYQSWKFPDKLSIDVDIDQLLNGCVYSEEDEEDNAVAHVMLYDLLIDRYLLRNNSDLLPCPFLCCIYHDKHGCILL